MNPWSLRCSKLALGKTNKVCLSCKYLFRVSMVREKVGEKSLFSKPRNCQGFLTSVREFFNLSQNQEILKNRFIKCQTTMNTNILSPVACPYEHKTEVK